MSATKIVGTNIHSIDVTILRKSLINWGRRHFQLFPWRMTRDPYQILISEIMLHRTQARQVVPVYERFIQKYPDALNLAQATREELHDILYSLGLRWRIEFIYEMAGELRGRFDNEVPVAMEDLLSLPGISEYIAGAVRCFAWNLPEPLIDTNTVRIIGRLFGLEIKDSSRRNKRFRELLTALVSPDEPRAYNFALLDLAHQVCLRRQSPMCYSCPIQGYCTYGSILLASDDIAHKGRNLDG